MAAASANRTARSQANWGWRVGVLSCALLGAGCSTTKPRPDDQVLFDHYQVVTGQSAQQVVLPGFFLSRSTAEVAVVQSNGGRAQLTLYGFDGSSWESVLDASLAGVAFVDTVSVDAADRLLIYRPGQLSWFDPQARLERPLVSVDAPFARGDGGAPHIDISRDLNGDGLEDLVLPDFDGFWISLQQRGGAFEQPLKLGPPEPFLDDIALEQHRPYREQGISAATAPWYLSRVHQLDHNQDGRLDLVFWHQDHFQVYPQNEQGRFAGEPQTFTTDAYFDSDGAYALYFAYGDKSTLPLVLGLHDADSVTVLHSMRDIDADGITDLVTQTVNGRSLLKLRSTYQVHLGRRGEAGVAFSPNPDLTVRPQSKAGHPLGYAWPTFADLNGDGDLELMLQLVKTSIGGMIRALAGKSVAIDLEFFELDPGGRAESPTVGHQVRPSLDVSGNRPFFPTVLLGDITGDGRADLLVGQHFEELRVFPGIEGPELFAAEPVRVGVRLPGNERHARLVDLNRDGKQDVLIQLAPPAEPNSMAILIAR